ncbi:hypothetical protein EC150811_05138 [Escherichia coli O145:H28]|nr:hypothetical protein EC150811_05138 [Escherichia coli O145:H28]
MTSPDLIQADLHRMSWSQLAKAAEESTVHHDYTRALSKRKLTAVCSHQTRIGNLDAHLI